MDNSQIIDHKIIDKSDVLKALKQAGFTRSYELKNGSIIVKESDAIRISLKIKNHDIQIKKKIPQIGNAVQVVVTVIVWIALTEYFQALGSIIIGIILGQLISFIFFQPKLNELKDKVEIALEEYLKK